LNYVLPEINSERDILLVDINFKEFSSDRRIDRKGLKIANKDYSEDSIIILMSFETEESLKKSNLEFRGLISHSNVGFIRLPDIKLIEKEVKRILACEKREDATAFALYSYENQLQILAQLQHNMGWVSDPTRRKDAVERAKRAGLEGSDEEIVKQVQNWKRDSSGYFEGKTLDGIFVDALDTLFDSEWNLNENVLKRINELKNKMNKDVFIISDSKSRDVEDAKKKANLSFQTLSKFTLRGVILELVIDNLSEEEFKEKYNITSQKFITVSEL